MPIPMMAQATASPMGPVANARTARPAANTTLVAVSTSRPPY